MSETLTPLDGPYTSKNWTAAVSWPAIIAGAVGASAVTLALFALGAGLGFAAANPWTTAEPAKTFAVTAAIWMIIAQWISSCLGGYLAGRLRTRWGVHGDEVFFRDTAHGFLAWALATVIVAGTVVASGSAAVNAAAHTDYAATAADTLLRSSTAAPADAALRGEVTRVVAQGAADGDLTADDRAYLANVIAVRSNISPEAASDRVGKAIIAAKDAANEARKTASRAAFAAAISMIIGAFIAAVSAVFGGRLRDEHD